MALSTDNNESESDSGCPLPDFAVCHVRRAELNGFFYCLTPNSASCQHFEAHADKPYCFHPDASQLKS